MSFKIDELQWSEPETANEMQGIHSNSVLYYFMRSPYFDKTSNNNTVYNQALHNHNMFPVLETRERFEDFLRSMSGVEYIVHQAPAEMAPGTGTGVWVIRKQLRRKRNDGQPDDLTVYADYFVVGYNIYQAPTLADVLSSRITSMAVALGKAFPAMNSMQTWSPAEGHYYETTGKAAAGEDGVVENQALRDEPDDEDQGVEEEEEEDDEDDDSSDEDAMDVDKTETTTRAKAAHDDADSEDDSDDDMLDPRLAEESYAIHMMYGGEYMDEQPISGRPGDFHIALAGGGRSAVGGAAGAARGKATADAADANKDGTGSGKATPKDGKEAKKSGATTPKPKRRKSKGAAA
ncbi:Mediator of RNA polymerase II transcription subunit 6 [Sporothrix brasiliensis 5110]|uniref:Mediator of RNA polymerase II transcription subunit 6 n=1 Tax=Sporothrix brasiliensis 5110 TaxID=1398154 RepID=A0A0C2JDP6_9PEZI|nr:Mediator of RNA polymerase II transcription subunit 6 [Sporothrix brasiliensis 5110]KIH95057.1 Mediator of RNA polymerase II transcription subunit 6 [Sporothrix brasiliensis 5110]